MNKDMAASNVEPNRGEVKVWWSKLTEDDLERAVGRFDVLVGLLQEKYGYTRVRATEEINKRMAAFNASQKMKI